MLQIYKTNWQGVEVIKMIAGGYEATVIPSVGGNVIELNHLEKNMKIMRQIDSIEDYMQSPAVYGTPLLFPPNRIDGGQFKVRSRSYQFPINEPNRNNSLHGFLQDKAFKVSSMDKKEDEVILMLEYKADDKTDFYDYFPHPFTCHLVVSLSSEGLTQKLIIKNDGNDFMPLAVGYHTAINLHFAGKASPGDVKMLLSIGGKIELDERALPTGRYLPLDGQDKLLRQSGQEPLYKDLDDHFTMKCIQYNNREFHGAILDNVKEGKKVVYEVGPQFKHWMVWNCNKAGDFICPEPQTWLVNAPNYSLPDEQTGLIVLEAGEVFEEYTKLYVE